jgi:hemerythrin-like metal-binding protein
MLNHLASGLGPTPTIATDHAGTLHRLYHHTRAHFIYEEKLMHVSGFRDLVQHQREHTMLLAELKSFTGALASGRTPADAALLGALRHWLVSHIITSDREFANHYLPLQPSPHSIPHP